MTVKKEKPSMDLWLEEGKKDLPEQTDLVFHTSSLLHSVTLPWR